MSRKEGFDEWDLSDEVDDVDITVVMNVGRSQSRKESHLKLEEEQLRLDENYANVERELAREKDIAQAFTNIERYANMNCVEPLQCIPFAEFREFCIAEFKLM